MSEDNHPSATPPTAEEPSQAAHAEAAPSGVVVGSEPAGAADSKPVAPVTSHPTKRHHLPSPKQLLPAGLRRRLGRNATPFAVGLIIIVIALIGFGGWQYHLQNSASDNGVVVFSAKTVSFRVISTTPSKDQMNVSPTTAVTIQFSQPVNPQKLQGNLFITPTVSGTYTAGKTKSEVVFTPDVPFAKGTKVQVMLNGTYQSNQGSKLGANFVYGFTTSLSQDGIIFEDSNSLYTTVSSALSGKTEDYSLVFGDSVLPGATVTLYKADMNHLLKALVYDTKTTNGYDYPSFLDLPIDTSAMQQLSTKIGLNNGSKFSVTQTNGVYLAVATDSKGSQLGHVWVDYSDFGLLARQDDQKLILDAQDPTTDKELSATVQLYNLRDGVNQQDSASVDGLTTLAEPFSPTTDVVVASDGTSQALVPLSILESQGDIRVDRDLDQALKSYGVTDRPTYGTADTVRYAGFLRTDRDAQYGVPTPTTIHLYVASYAGGDALASFTAKVDISGTFSGSFTTAVGWLTGGESAHQFEIFATAPDGIPSHDVPVSSFTVNGQAKPTANITVSFNKPDYLPTDTVQATVSATDASGKALANAQLDVHSFSTDYYENDPTANLANFNNVGTELSGSPASLKLNGSGQATYTVNVHNLPSDGNSQQVTIQASLSGTTTGAAGGASAIVHQGNGSLRFGVGRTAVTTTGTVIGRVYAADLSGAALANTKVSYTLGQSGSSPTVSGSVTTDGNGFAKVSVAVPNGSKENDSLLLTAWVSDAKNNRIQATNYYYVQNSSDTYDTSGAGLQDLDVSGSSGAVTVGQTVNLTINAPEALNALVTMDRGRVYNAQMVNLNQGDNSFSFKVTPELAPSFTLTFNYFKDGVYHSEGVLFTVSNPAKQATVKLTPSSQTVAANSNTTVQISATATASQLSPTLIVSVVNEAAYSLYNQVTPDIFGTLYPSLPIMTSSSSSLSDIGSGGGGRCGGGDGAANDFTNPVGTNLLWLPKLSTNSAGNASINFTPPPGKWRVSVYAMDGDTVVGSSSTTITAN